VCYVVIVTHLLGFISDQFLCRYQPLRYNCYN